MSDSLDSGLWINYVLSLLLKKVVVPEDFHSQCDAVAEILKDDVSGLVDVLTDFAVESANVNFYVESENSEYNRIINKWLENINMSFKGRIQPGVNSLATEYYKERWKGSSFPVLKMSKWERGEGGLILPSQMFFVDGSSIHAKAKDDKDPVKHLFSYDYYLGSMADEKYKLDGSNIIFARPYGRWFDKYPIPYLIKRGVYHNWKIIDSLKSKQSEILDQIIPYLLLIKKGSPDLVRENVKAGYSDEELQEVKTRLQELMDEVRSSNTGDKSIKAPMRVTNFDEEIKHLIPNMKDVFSKELFETSERNILSALGFVDVIEATSTSRRESILNPKAFIEETKAGVKDFKGIIKQILYTVGEKNASHVKYMNIDSEIHSSPITGFMTDEFKEKVRQLFDRGRISSKTAVELIAEVSFETEVMRRKQEAKDGIDVTMYPVVTQNREGEAIDLPSDFINPDQDEEDIPDDKKDEVEKQNYNISASFSCECIKCGYKITSKTHCKDLKCPKCQGQMRRSSRPGPGKADNELEKAPYQNIKDLPATIKKNISSGLQPTFLRVFNKAYETYNDESRAFRIAWSVIKKIAKKNDKGIWVKKTSKVKLSKADIELFVKELEKET